ncbi:hypothetical protein FACS189451_04240 [Bacteroidia bacterium]|nr:hypothetical protein FACS189451_04240 [Bacteroidia bacterium]
MKQLLIFTLFIICLSENMHSQAKLFVEAESFASKNGWVVDQQFSDLMGSPYLMAHGMGTPVHDAVTTVDFPETGTYRMFVRTYNWTSPWYDGAGPGGFQVIIDGSPVSTVFGNSGKQWTWQDGGTVKITNKKTQIRLHDLTGFNGRCDALYFTQTMDFVPPAKPNEVNIFRQKQIGVAPKDAGQYDLVVIGGGVAGMCAAISSARLGLKVAIIHDRPVWGGNNSSEVRVHLGGRIGLEPYPELGGIVNELSPQNGGNAQPAGNYEDSKKTELINAEPNITQFLNYRAFAVTMDGQKIQSVTAKQIETGEEFVFHAPIFADCTGDGTIGVLAGADFTMGRESQSDFGEPTAPEKSDKLTMGSSVQWYSEEQEKNTSFPLFQYGVRFNEDNIEDVTKGEWTWETGMNYDQINDFERIRDYGLMVVYSNWSFLKNEYSGKADYANCSLAWVAYIAGKRESRRLLGDYIMKLCLAECMNNIWTN